MNKLLKMLLAIKMFSKDIHYRAKGSSFYSDHLLADDILKDIDTYMDEINELHYLGRGEDAPASSEILQGAIEYIPHSTEIDQMFEDMQNLLLDVLTHIEEVEAKEEQEDLTLGDTDLLARLSSYLIQKNGFIWRRTK